MATIKLLSSFSLQVSVPFTEKKRSLFSISGVPLQVSVPFAQKMDSLNKILTLPLAIAGNALADGSESEKDNVSYVLFQKE